VDIAMVITNPDDPTKLVFAAISAQASSVVLFEQVAPDRWREAAELPL
jgi:hypothetical protein